MEAMLVDDKDLTKDDSDEFLGSSPEPEATAVIPGAPEQAPKRKGGRKPIYATSEERKQRNRQAQAAFRERRTEYIKQLEETIRVHEQNLHNLQAAHRHAADECLMLRYKNSLLERILLEKGIDVQAELRAKTGSPNLAPSHLSPNLIQPPPLTQNRSGRYSTQRSTSSMANKIETGMSGLAPLHPSSVTTASPKTRPTPSDHSGSPVTNPAFGNSPAASEPNAGNTMRQGVMSGGLKRASTGPVNQVLVPGPSRVMAPQVNPLQQQSAMNVHVKRMSIGSHNSTPFYHTKTPAYQAHIQQLEQEYDAAADMMEDTGDAADTPSGPGPYPGGYVVATEPPPMALSSPQTTNSLEDQHHQQQAHAHAHAHAQVAPQAQPNQPVHGLSMTQLLDPATDWDPFGLSASMAFPSQFSFDTSNMR